MRIAALVSSLHAGGAERVMAGLASAWAAQGHDVHLITLFPGAEDFYPLHPGVVRVALGAEGRSANVAMGALRTIGRLRALRRAIVSASPDVIVSFIDRMNVLVLLATGGLGLPVVVSERIDPTVQALRTGWGPLRRMLYPCAAALVVQTEGAARWAQPYNRRVEIIPNPLILDVTSRPSAPPARWVRPTVIAVGRLDPQKGYDLLIRAFAEATVIRPDWHLAFLGDGSERDSLEALAKQQGVGSRVHFIGRVPDPSPYLQSSDIFALSSLYEGFPNALLEGLAAGLPAVATDCQSGPRDLIEEGVNGLLVPVGDVDRFADALGRLIGDDPLRARLGAGARSVAIRFPVDVIASRWTDLFATLRHQAGES